MKKGLILILSIVMVVCISISATLAYLFVETTPVENTFEYGDINITLDESEDLVLKMIPGNTITKDPTVTVLKDSEACWLFVKIDESTTTDFDKFMTYAIAEGWTLYNTTEAGADINTDDNDSYWIYREVGAVTEDTDFEILANNQVSVKNTVLKIDLNAFDTDKNGELSEEEKAALPKLTFTAYAVQKSNVADVAAASAIAQTKGVPANS